MAEERPWYFKDATVIMAILAFAFIALPLVWFSPHYSLRRKVVVSVIVTVASYFMWQMTSESMKALGSYYDYWQ